MGEQIVRRPVGHVFVFPTKHVLGRDDGIQLTGQSGCAAVGVALLRLRVCPPALCKGRSSYSTAFEGSHQLRFLSRKRGGGYRGAYDSTSRLKKWRNRYARVFNHRLQ